MEWIGGEKSGICSAHLIPVTFNEVDCETAIGTGHRAQGEGAHAQTAPETVIEMPVANIGLRRLDFRLWPLEES